MIRPLIAALTLLAIAAPAASAAPQSCTRDGGKLLAAGGSVRVVSVKEKPRNAETRRERIYGCWTATGRRFTLFEARDFGLDSIERDTYEIVGGRYIAAIRHFENGAGEGRSAATYDAQKHTAVFSTKPCDEVSSGDFTGVEDVAFLKGGGIAYTCWQRSRIVDGKGDRALEADGNRVTGLAVSRNRWGYGERLYYTVNDTAVKALDL